MDECKISLDCDCDLCKRVATLFKCEACDSDYKLDNELIENEEGEDEYLYVCSNEDCEDKENKKHRGDLDLPLDYIMKMLYLSDYSSDEEDSSSVTIEIIDPDEYGE